MEPLQRNNYEPQKSWKDLVREEILEGENGYARALDIFLILIIIASVAATILETIPSIHAEYGTLLLNVEILFTVIFTLEYLLRAITAKKTTKFIFSLTGIIDLISILPLFITIIFKGEQILNLVRLLRLARVVSRLIKATKNINKTSHLLLHIKNRLGTDEKILYYFKASRRRFILGYPLAVLILGTSLIEVVFRTITTELGIANYSITITAYILLFLSLAAIIRYELMTWYHRYAITTHGVMKSTGILHEEFKRTTHTYMADTYLNQSFLDKILNIGTVKVRTTGSEDQNIDLEDISKPAQVKRIIHDNIIRIHHAHYNTNTTHRQ